MSEIFNDCDMSEIFLWERISFSAHIVNIDPKKTLFSSVFLENTHKGTKF